MDMSILSKTNKREHANKDHQTVLAVDDQPVCLAILEKLLAAQGVTVDTAQDGYKALALWKAKKHSIVVTDCQMPRMDGYALAKAIREIEQTEGLDRSAIISFSANTLKEQQQRGLEAGFDEVLTKPISNTKIESLFSKLKNAKSEVQSNLNSIIDFNILKQVFPDTNKQLQILSGFKTHINTDYSALQAYVKEGDFSSIESIAHRMKGSSRMVGVNGIANVCEKIEQAAKDGLVPHQSVFVSLDKNIQTFISYLSEKTTSNTSNIKSEGGE